MLRITTKQAEVLAVLEEYIDRTGTSPSLEELGSAIGVSASSAYYRVKSLVRKGVVERGGAWEPRTMRVSDTYKAFRDCELSDEEAPVSMTHEIRGLGDVIKVEQTGTNSPPHIKISSGQSRLRLTRDTARVLGSLLTSVVEAEDSTT